MFGRSVSRFVQSHAKCGMRLSSRRHIKLGMSNQHDVLATGGSGDFSQSQDQILTTRLSGYFEALRSRKEYCTRTAAWYLAFYHRKLYATNDAKEEVLPEVLPFPVPTCNLDELVRLIAIQNSSAPKNVSRMGLIKNVDLMIDILRDLVYEIGRVHELMQGHLYNFKPDTVIMFESECSVDTLLTFDMGCCEWKAPETRHCQTGSQASDMFTFGCILYYCITGGYHPFGDTSDERFHNIGANKMDLSRANADACNLISLLLQSDPELRPTAQDVLSHPFFWNLSTKVSFLDNMSSRSRREHDLAIELESKAPILMNRDWSQKLSAFSRVMNSLDETTTPKDIPEDVFGPEGSPTFLPSLLIAAYEVAFKLYKNDEYNNLFEKYNFYKGRYRRADYYSVFRPKQ